MELPVSTLCPQVVFALDEAIRRKRGLIVITGPAGGGKTSTAESLIRTVGSAGKNAVLENLHDASLPADVCGVLADDIREDEIAQRVCNLAEQTLVVGVLRSGRGVGAFERLLDMGVTATTLANVSPVVVTQLLLKRLCTRCRKPRVLTRGSFAVFDAAADYVAELSGGYVFDPVGCEHCRDGYDGHVVVAEAVAVPPGRSFEESHRLAQFGSISRDAGVKLLCGLTSIAEVQSVLWAIRQSAWRARCGRLSGKRPRRAVTCRAPRERGAAGYRG